MKPDVLTKTQFDLIKRLACLEKWGFYMAGGTGLALQLSHRTSVDFDFYSPKTFIAEEVLAELRKDFTEISVRQALVNTLILSINNVDLSFFYYPYKLLKPLIKYESVNLASRQDIAAMKVAAIVQRGKRRDFIDIYFLLQRLSLKEIIKFAIQKYPGYQEMLILRALIYFEDAEKEELGRKIVIFDKSCLLYTSPSPRD